MNAYMHQQDGDRTHDRDDFRPDDARNLSIRIHGLDVRGSTCDGPGIRSVVFFQGCHRHCPGCHNRQTWDPHQGTAVAVPQLAQMIVANTPSRRVTLSGGEPLMQKRGLIALAIELKTVGFDIAVYTGNTLAEVPDELLTIIDYIKTGEFQEEKKSSVIQYVGSSNQQFIRLH